MFIYKYLVILPFYLHPWYLGYFVDNFLACIIEALFSNNQKRADRCIFIIVTTVNDIHKYKYHDLDPIIYFVW